LEQGGVKVFVSSETGSESGRTKAFYLGELIERGLEDLEDYYPGMEVRKYSPPETSRMYRHIHHHT
jgi:hypothetical protein